MSRLLSPYKCIERIELNPENYTETERIEAWQYIYDNGLYLYLQGFYGRTIRDLLSAGVIQDNSNSDNSNEV